MTFLFSAMLKIKMTKKESSKKYRMWKTYKNHFELENETREISLIPARYEVHLLAGGLVQISVRCRFQSRVWYACREMGYDWY